MLSEPCLLCGELDCPEWEEHAQLVRLDVDTWTPDEPDPDEPDRPDDEREQ